VNLGSAAFANTVANWQLQIPSRESHVRPLLARLWPRLPFVSGPTVRARLYGAKPPAAPTVRARFCGATYFEADEDCLAHCRRGHHSSRGGAWLLAG
jgi:hypothetical protein